MRSLGVLDFSMVHPWAILPDMLDVIAGLIARRVAGEAVDPAVIAAVVARRKAEPLPQAGDAAIIPVYGVLVPRGDQFTESSGATSFDSLRGQLRQAAQTTAIKTIVFDVDSPGGNVAGATEFAAEMTRARKIKPIVVQANYLMASAAYWPFASATEIVAAPSARVGSLGVCTMHESIGAALEKAGVQRQYLSAGVGKVAANELGPLDEAARARIQTLIDETYGRMVADVVKGRGGTLTEARVRDDWQAHVYSADAALALGMIDRIGTLDETIARVQGGAEAGAWPPPAPMPAPVAAAVSRADVLAYQRALLELDL
jgi:signal peptide peptidase SppA